MNNFGFLARRVAIAVNEPDLISDIKDACLKKQAFCFGDDNTRVVLRLKLREGVPYVLVWLGVGIAPGTLDKFNPIVTEMTRVAGARWFEFCTVRKGFIRVAHKYGFERMANDEAGRFCFKKMV